MLHEITAYMKKKKKCGNYKSTKLLKSHKIYIFCYKTEWYIFLPEGGHIMMKNVSFLFLYGF